MGVTAGSIRQWGQKLRQGGLVSPAGTGQPEADEMRRLRKDYKRLELENEILKKAAAYFARESL